MKFIIQLFALLIFAISLHAQQPSSIPDSIKKIQAENMKLFRESFTANAALIDSAKSRIEAFVTMKDIKDNADNYKYYQHCNEFVEFLFQLWLEQRKKKPK